MNVDILKGMVVVSVRQVAQLTGECEVLMTFLDVVLSGLHLARKSLTTEGTEAGQDLG